MGTHGLVSQLYFYFVQGRGENANSKNTASSQDKVTQTTYSFIVSIFLQFSKQADDQTSYASYKDKISRSATCKGNSTHNSMQTLANI